MKFRFVIFSFFIFTFFVSCESDQEKNDRLARERQEQIEIEKQHREKEVRDSIRLENSRIAEEKRAERKRLAREAQLEKERKEQEIYDKYKNNSLRTGSTPYSKYYGGNATCNDYGCSGIKVRTSNSDVLVTIKKNNKVVRHAYIQARNSYTFSFPNGTYQAYFYYGKGWNPEKEMKKGKMKGGFMEHESFQKDDPQSLRNEVLTYELILQQNGNFDTRPSNSEEAL